MTPPTLEQPAKLPKWAQQHIAVLQARIETDQAIKDIAVKQRDIEAANLPNSNFWFGGGASMISGPRRFVYTDEILIGDPSTNEYSFSVRMCPHYKGRVLIHSPWRGIIIRPEVSNSISLDRDPR